MTTFALVHGAWHGAWCWERVQQALVGAGHDVVAVDLPSDDPRMSFDDYADVVVDALRATSRDVVLVGHSLAGLTVPLVATRRPVASLVYVCALLARPGVSLGEALRDDPDTLLPDYRRGLEPVDDLGTTRWVDEELARDTFFHDCSDADVRRAVSRLRPQATTPYARPCTLEQLPAVPTTYVLAAEDRLVNPAWSRRVAGDWADRVVELSGGHSPFLSQAPVLTELLLEHA